MGEGTFSIIQDGGDKSHGTHEVHLSFSDEGYKEVKVVNESQGSPSLGGDETDQTNDWRRLRRHLDIPTRGGSVPIEQVVVLSGVEVHDDAGSIQQLLVTAGAGNAVVAVSAVASVVQLLRLHLATHRYPG